MQIRMAIGWQLSDENIMVMIESDCIKVAIKQQQYNWDDVV